MGFTYQTVGQIASGGLDEILQRIGAIPLPIQKPVVEAVLGLADDSAAVPLSKAYKVFVEKIAPHQINGKSPAQRDRWVKGKKARIDHFIEVVGDLDIAKITRADARTYFCHWMEKIAPKEGAPTHTADIGNRRLGVLAGVYRDYFAYMQEKDRENPFDGLRFKRKGMKKRKRPPFSKKWITDQLLKPGALAGLNDQARHILLICANTGARPSEICNLMPERIMLSSDVPHIKIEPDEDPESPREIKTESSIRIVPLVGMALEAMKQSPSGFARYRDKGNSLSATLNKYLSENKLLETDKHSVYSLRHSFEDRRKQPLLP
ncbi:integrase [Ochrobactrum daejeonense]|nr:integrase [Brucella daejeonensis]